MSEYGKIMNKINDVANAQSKYEAAKLKLEEEKAKIMLETNFEELLEVKRATDSMKKAHVDAKTIDEKKEVNELKVKYSSEKNILKLMMLSYEKED